jgi:hypothetical protein
MRTCRLIRQDSLMLFYSRHIFTFRACEAENSLLEWATSIFFEQLRLVRHLRFRIPAEYRRRHSLCWDAEIDLDFTLDLQAAKPIAAARYSYEVLPVADVTLQSLVEWLNEAANEPNRLRAMASWFYCELARGLSQKVEV